MFACLLWLKSVNFDRTRSCSKTLKSIFSARDFKHRTRKKKCKRKRKKNLFYFRSLYSGQMREITW